MFNFEYPTYVNFLIMILLFPFLPFLLTISEFINQRTLSCEWMNYDCALEKFTRIRKQVAQFIKMELCIETVMQIVFSILMLILSNSATRTQQGLETLFDDSQTDGDNLLLGLSPYVFIIANILWSLKTCWMSFIRGMKATKDHFPSTTFYFLGLYVILAIVIRCTTSIIYFAPILGLLDLLRHFQAESYPFTSARGKNDDIVYLNGKPSDWTWHNISRFDYTDFNNPVPPDITLYTYCSLEEYLYGYWILLSGQTLVHLIAKRLSNPEPFKRQNWIQMIAHGIENCQIPVPMEDWDDQHGSIEYYSRAQKTVEVEVGLTMIVNLIFNLILTVPMWILCKMKQLEMCFCTNQLINERILF